jgi:hypothetical protein
MKEPAGLLSVRQRIGHQDLKSSQRLHRLSWLLDECIRLPGGWRIGLDGIVGLVPGVGDAMAALVSSYFVWTAYRVGAPGRVLRRMSMNILLELVLGSVPLVGDLFDFAFKANVRNYRLLEEYLSGAPKSPRLR